MCQGTKSLYLVPRSIIMATDWPLMNLFGDYTPSRRTAYPRTHIFVSDSTSLISRGGCAGLSIQMGKAEYLFRSKEIGWEREREWEWELLKDLSDCRLKLSILDVSCHPSRRLFTSSSSLFLAYAARETGEAVAESDSRVKTITSNISSTRSTSLALPSPKSFKWIVPHTILLP